MSEDEPTFQELLAEYSRDIERDPQHALAYFMRGNTYHEMQDYAATIADLTRAIELDPQFAEAYYNRGNAYYDMQDYAAALADYDRAIELNPQDAAVYTNRGSTYHKTQQYEAALADYGRAIELNQDVIAYYNTACAHALQGHVAEACAWLEKAIALDEQSREDARTDTDFDLIRDAPCFQALIGLVEPPIE